MSQTNRRRFLQTGGAAVVGASALAAPAVARAQGATVIRMQSAWPAANVFQEFAQQ